MADVRIIRLFWHQRRRFALVSIVAFLAGWALNSGGSTLAAPLTALCFALALAAALILRQSRRNVVTVLALLFLIVGLASQLLPSIVVPPLLAGSVIAVAMMESDLGVGLQDEVPRETNRRHARGFPICYRFMQGLDSLGFARIASLAPLRKENGLGTLRPGLTNPLFGGVRRIRVAARRTVLLSLQDDMRPGL